MTLFLQNIAGLTERLWHHESSKAQAPDPPWVRDMQNPTSRFSEANPLKTSTAFLSLLFRLHLQDQGKKQILVVISSWQASCPKRKDVGTCWIISSTKLCCRFVCWNWQTGKGIFKPKIPSVFLHLLLPHLLLPGTKKEKPCNKYNYLFLQ